MSTRVPQQCARATSLALLLCVFAACSSKQADQVSVTRSALTHAITFDAHSLSRQQLVLYPPQTYIDTGTTPASLQLDAGTDYILETLGGGAIGWFSVKADGTVAYDVSLDGKVYTGLNTTQLTVKPHPITVNATAADPQTLELYYGATDSAFNSSTARP